MTVLQFPYHRYNRRQLICLNCGKQPTTVEGPPYCDLHHPQNHIANAAEQATDNAKMTRLKNALNTIARN